MSESVRVLYVGDDPPVADRVATHLRRDGFEVLSETNPSAVLDRLRVADANAGEGESADGDARAAVDCVVSDYEVGETTGLDLLSSVRERYERLPFVLVGGRGAGEVANEAISAGVTDYVRRGTGEEQYVLLANRVRNAVDRYRTEGRLRRCESLVQNIRQGACIVGADGRLAFTNRVFETLTGVSADELVGEPVSALRDAGIVDGDAYRALRAGIERVLSGERTHERLRLSVNVLADVERVEVDLSPLRDVDATAVEGGEEAGASGASRGVVAVVTDVTAQTRYQERLSALHSASRELTTATTYDDVARIVSGAAENILGYPLVGVAFYESERDALVIRALSEAAEEAVDELEIPRGTGIAWRVLESGEGEVLENVAEDPDVLNPDTEIRSEIILPLGEEGVLMAGSCESDDLDDSRASLTRILASNASAALERVEREQLLRRRERESKYQNEQLEQVASVVSHDLRNPLNLASGQLDLLRANYEGGDDDAVAERLDRIENAHRRMRRIIEDMLDLARNEQPVGELEPVVLGSVVRESWTTATSGSDANLEVVGELGTLESHEGRLKQLFENLFRNAIEHGGESDSVAVRVGLLDGGFFVEDDGDGIPESDREEVFDPGVSTNPDGTGLGLGIVRTIARAHGWTVTVTDGESGGARFEIRTDGSGSPGEPDRETPG